VFDLGHTLWDYAPTEQARRLGTLQLHSRLVDELGDLTPHPRELDRLLHQQLEGAIAAWYADASRLDQPTSDVFVRKALAALESPMSEELVSDVTQIFFGTELDVPVLLPETLFALASLHAEGIVMGCITNTIALPSAIEDLLRRLGLMHYLDAVVASSGTGYRKPHRSLFQRALATLRVEPGEALFVGDRLLDDISGAKAVGMRAVLTHQYRQESLDTAIVPPDAVISRLGDLPAVIASLQR
jgi:HAD superfamily hydrolase (TIGR01662 family)